MDINKSYTLPGWLIVALIAGTYTVGEVDWAEAQAAAVDVSKRLEYVLPGNLQTAVDSQLVGYYCDQMEAELGIADGLCTPARVKARLIGNLDLVWSDTDEDGVRDAWKVAGSLRLPAEQTVTIGD